MRQYIFFAWLFSPLELGFLSLAIKRELTDTDGIGIGPPASESNLRADKRYKYFAWMSTQTNLSPLAVTTPANEVNGDYPASPRPPFPHRQHDTSA